MSNVLRLALVDPNDPSRDSLKAMLLSLDVVWLEAECSRYEFFLDVVEQTTPDIGVVCLDADIEKGIALIENLRQSIPECSILAVSSSSDGHLILRTMRAGAKEFLTLPIQMNDLSSALERIGEQRFGGTGKKKGCTVIAVAGATGGVGATSLAVNLGCTFAADENKSVVLVDLDLALGDADVFLDVIPDYTLVDVAQNVARLDYSLLKRSLTKHSSGLYLLPRPVQLQDTQSITREDLGRVLGLLRSSFTHLILDLSKSYSPLDMVAMEEADHTLLVTQLDLPCLRNVVRLMSSLEEMEGLKEKVKVVVNRIGLEDGQISLKKAKETIGKEIYWQLPNDYKVMVEVRNNGTPLIEQAPRASITQAIVAMAHSLCGETEVPVSDEGSGGVGRWIRFWPGKSKDSVE